MRKNRKKLFAMVTTVLLLLCAGVNCFANDEMKAVEKMDITKELRLSDEGVAYFVSSTAGDDENDGLSEETAWKSFANLSNTDLRPGDRVLLMRGDVWHERLTVRGNGREDAWIFVGSYGDLKDPKPEISLSNGRNDIALLATDISVGGKSGFGLNYIWIDNIKISNSFLGIYFRYDSSTDNKGVRVTNCSFENINCPDLMEEAMTDAGFLLQTKGDLEDYQGGSVVQNAGGGAEYIWPTAINIGGRPPLPLANVTVPGRAEPANAVSEIQLYQNEFDSCVVAVGANCYHYHFGTGPNQCYTYTQNWSVCGMTSENTMTMFNIDSADFGYDGTADSEWGRWSNIQAKGGMEGYTMSFGTTQALFSCCQNLYISNSSFNGSRNNGQADGCGFDFERSVHNFTLDSCVIANNEGQGVLVMQTTMENRVTGEQAFTPNTNNIIKGCLFYNNMTSVFNDHYRYDVTVFNPNNERFLVMDNTFYFRQKTAGGAKVEINQGDGKHRPYGPETEGVQGGRNTMICSDDLPQLADVIKELGMEDSVAEHLPVDKTWYHYTDEGALLLETERETEARVESETVDNAGTVTETEIETETEFAVDPHETADEEIDGKETEQDSVSGGCRANVGGTACLASAVSAAIALAEKKRKRKESTSK